MKRRLQSLFLAAALLLSLIPGVTAAEDSSGRYAENTNGFTHAYVVQGDTLKVGFRYDTVDAPCASPVWLFKTDLTGSETQEELDQKAYKLLTSDAEPLFFSEGWTHSLNTNYQTENIETADLETGTYLIVAAAMSDRRFSSGGGTTIHYKTATGVALHVVAEAKPIETCEYWYCDADGKEVRQLIPGETLVISHENNSPGYRIKLKTFPSDATERVTDLSASVSDTEYDPNLTAIPGFSYEDGLYITCAQTCGSGYLWVKIDSFGQAEEQYARSSGIPFEVPCHPDGPVKVQKWYTCTEPGFQCAYCYGYGTSCDTVYGYEILDPPGHQLKEIYAITADPTATRPGVALGLCKNCLGRWVEGEIPPVFSDVEPDAFYSEALDYGYANGWVTGLTADTFGPGAGANRAQVVTFLWRAAGCPEPAADENPFEDVQAGSFYEKAVLWAVEEGITTGTDAAHFSPFMACNRATVVTFLHRAFGTPAVEEPVNPFRDVPEGTWYTDAVLWAVENGITNGLSADTFGPGTKCNRAQIVTFLYRAYTE